MRSTMPSRSREPPRVARATEAKVGFSPEPHVRLSRREMIAARWHSGFFSPHYYIEDFSSPAFELLAYFLRIFLFQGITAMPDANSLTIISTSRDDNHRTKYSYQSIYYTNAHHHDAPFLYQALHCTPLTSISGFSPPPWEH